MRSIDPYVHQEIRIVSVTSSPLVLQICINELGEALVQVMVRRGANAALLWIGLLGTDFSEVQIKIKNFKLNVLSVKWQPFCPGGGGSVPRPEARWHQATTKIKSESLLSIGSFWTNFNDSKIEIQNFLMRKCSWKCLLHFVFKMTYISGKVQSVRLDPSMGHFLRTKLMT